jgi:hydrogenase large subunit
MTTIVIDPLSRIEGHLKIEAVVENGVVKEARSSGMLFRGLEMILKGHDPFDAQFIVQRICGVCPTSHAMAAALNLDAAFGIADRTPDNGRILRNLIQGANYLQSHILHFYHLAALDYVDVTGAAGYDGHDPALVSVKDFIARANGDGAALGPFFPRYEGDYRLPDDINVQAVAHYVQALDMRRLGHEMSAIFSGKMPHNAAIIPGGVTEIPTVDKIANFLWRLNQLRQFIREVYIPDVVSIAGAYKDYFDIGRGCGNLLSYGCFDLEANGTDLAARRRLFRAGTASLPGLKYASLDPAAITEDVKYSWYKSPSGLPPVNGQTMPDPKKDGAYSWLKSPRYRGTVYEVGPLARLTVSYTAGDAAVKQVVDGLLSHFKAGPEALFSVMGRHAARALDCQLVADNMADWLLQLKPGEPVAAEWQTPDRAQGMGLWEAPRGALGHWISIKNGKIESYQCVVPTTWNASPRDDQGQPGPIEQAITGTRIRDEDNPFELGRIVRAFDPCIACAVHVITPRGTEKGRFRVL